MGACFSSKTKATTLSPAPQISDLKSGHQQPPNPTNSQQVFKKEIFVIKHRVSHEINTHSDQESDQNPSSTTATSTGAVAGARLRTPSCSKEEVNAILAQCDRLSRSDSAGGRNPSYRRRYSRSQSSFDLGPLGLNMDFNDDYEVDDEDDAMNHHHRHRQPEVRVSSSRRFSSRERRISISPSRQSSSKDRRISISPGRRSESPFRNLNPNSTSGGSGNRPAKMVSVPATDKSNNAGVQQVVGQVVGPVKRIHVKRNVSPARTSLRVVNDNQSQERERNTREADCRRKSLVEIDNNTARSAQPRDCKRMRRLSRDLDMNPEIVPERAEPSSGTAPGPSPPSYASLLLEDIHNFHKKNASAATAPPSFDLPECVNKACLIMEAVADLNSSTSSLCSDERWRKPTSIKKESSGTVVIC